MTTFVLVPGGWCGGWVYDQVAARLRARGHEVLAITFSGEPAAANLDSHIREVVVAIESAVPDKVVLCGHSYAGMIISGVADLVPRAIDGLVYIDAYVPVDGDSCWALTTDAYRARFIAGAGADGYSVMPPAELGPRATPQPLATFVQRIRLRNAPEPAIRRTFIYLTGWSGSPFGPTYERLRDDPAWAVHVRPTGHDIMLEAPRELAQILLAAGSTSPL